jgi:hypothetical protein
MRLFNLVIAMGAILATISIFGVEASGTWAKAIATTEAGNNAANGNDRTSGLVNCVGKLYRQLGKGVTPENNAAIAILSVCRADIRFGVSKKINGR